jgi:hypothetical protein
VTARLGQRQVTHHLPMVKSTTKHAVALVVSLQSPLLGFLVARLASVLAALRIGDRGSQPRWGGCSRQHARSRQVWLRQIIVRTALANHAARTMIRAMRQCVELQNRLVGCQTNVHGRGPRGWLLF